MDQNEEYLKEQDAKLPKEKKSKAQQEERFSVKSFLAEYNKDLGPRPPSDLGKDETAVACICGIKEDKFGDELGWVQCDRCFIWQHIKCVGYDEEKEKDTSYYCERCDEFKSRPRPYTMEEAACLVKDLSSNEEEPEVPEPMLSAKRGRKKTETPLPVKEITSERRKVKEPLMFSPPTKKRTSSMASSPRAKRGRPPMASIPRPNKEKLTVAPSPVRKRGRPPLTSTPLAKEGKLPVDTTSPIKKTKMSIQTSLLPARQTPLNRYYFTRCKGPIVFEEQMPFSHNVVHKAVKKLAKEVKAEDFELPTDDDYYNERLGRCKSTEIVGPQLGALVVDESAEESDAPLNAAKPVIGQEQSTIEQDKQPEVKQNPVEELKGRRFSLEEYKLLQKNTGRISNTEKDSKKSGFMPSLDNVKPINLPDLPLVMETKPLAAKSEADLERYCFGTSSTEVVTKHFTTLTTVVSNEHDTLVKDPRDRRSYTSDLEFFNAEREHERQKGHLSLSARLDAQFGPAR